MKKNIWMVGSAAITTLAVYTLLPAQEPPQFQPKATVTVPIEFVASQPVNGNTVTGAPYSAEAVTETTQTLGDGNLIERRSSLKLYRDSQGRERQEEGGAEPTRILISDPVAKANFTLNVRTHTAQKSSAVLRIGSDSTANTRLMVELQTLDRVAKDLERARALAASDGTGTPPPPPPPSASRASASPATEQLSPQSIEGVYATGTRTTTTIPAGQIGNRNPIRVVDEVWYSPDLHMNVMTKHSDPRTGDVVYRLTNISRNEPDASLFQVPADYKITERGGRGRGSVTP